MMGLPLPLPILAVLPAAQALQDIAAVMPLLPGILAIFLIDNFLWERAYDRKLREKEINKRGS